MDAEIPVVPVPSINSGINDALPPLAMPRLAVTTERRTLLALGFGTFVAALVLIIPPLFFPQMARELQVSVPLLGQIMSAMLGLSVVLGLVIGPLSDRSGYRLLIVIGLVAAAVCLLVFGLAPTFPLLLLASAAGAVTDAGVLGPSLAIAGTAFTGTAARRAIGWTNAAQAGSAIIGVPLLAAIGMAAGWRVAFVVAGLTALAVVALAISWLPRDHHHASEPLRFSTILAPYRPLLRDGTMRRLYGATTLGAVCWFGLVTYLGAFLVEALGLGTGSRGAGLHGRRRRVRPGQSGRRRTLRPCTNPTAGRHRLSRHRRADRPGSLRPRRDDRFDRADHRVGADDGGGRGCHDRAPDIGDAEWSRDHDDLERVTLQSRCGWWRRHRRDAPCPLRL